MREFRTDSLIWAPINLLTAPTCGQNECRPCGYLRTDWAPDRVGELVRWRDSSVRSFSFASFFAALSLSFSPSVFLLLYRVLRILSPAASAAASTRILGTYPISIAFAAARKFIAAARSAGVSPKVA